MKRIFVVSLLFILVSSSVVAQSYRSELKLGHSQLSENYLQGESATSSASATLYMSEVKPQDFPLKEAAFVSQASNLGFGFSVQDVEAGNHLNSIRWGYKKELLGFSGEYIHKPGGWLFGLLLNKGERDTLPFETSEGYKFSIGKYFGKHTLVKLGYGKSNTEFETWSQSIGICDAVLPSITSGNLFLSYIPTGAVFSATPVSTSSPSPGNTLSPPSSAPYLPNSIYTVFFSPCYSLYLDQSSRKTDYSAEIKHLGKIFDHYVAFGLGYIKESTKNSFSLATDIPMTNRSSSAFTNDNKIFKGNISYYFNDTFSAGFLYQQNDSSINYADSDQYGFNLSYFLTSGVEFNLSYSEFHFGDFPVPILDAGTIGIPVNVRVRPVSLDQEAYTLGLTVRF